jgi:hypothetical protein
VLALFEQLRSLELNLDRHWIDCHRITPVGVVALFAKIEPQKTSPGHLRYRETLNPLNMPMRSELEFWRPILDQRAGELDSVRIIVNLDKRERAPRSILIAPAAAHLGWAGAGDLRVGGQARAPGRAPGRGSLSHPPGALAALRLSGRLEVGAGAPWNRPAGTGPERPPPRWQPGSPARSRRTCRANGLGTGRVRWRSMPPTRRGSGRCSRHSRWVPAQPNKDGWRRCRAAIPFTSGGGFAPR